MPPLFALADCNNFYVSCERVFQPRLSGQAVVVLSNNDSCVIARSEEAKAAGVPMGLPASQLKERFPHLPLTILSSNYVLYGDMSARVIQTLRQMAPAVAIYAKLPAAQGVVALTTPATQDDALATFPVTNLWGIGCNYARLLAQHDIDTARQFRDVSDHWVRQHMGVVGLRLVWELRGRSCLPLVECPPPQQSCTVSRSFGQPITTLEGDARSHRLLSFPCCRKAPA